MQTNSQNKKTELKIVPLITVRVILRRKIMVQGKSLCSVLNIRITQLTVLKVCFHLKDKTGFIISSKCTIYRYKGPVKLPLLNVIAKWNLQLNAFPKTVSQAWRLVWGLLCELTCVFFCFHRTYAYDFIA
ncbi:hypothetical protein HJG60_009934 [Phyllostomus discolor]|uniref:Uncharacterized protein n=1 Tax=Phyllostomus discolor TaxID=89673 RepID=A0A834B9Z0_9CHIR|nr:hypothetical protein HJG60_009934 [Phyllostomus discolor]